MEEGMKISLDHLEVMTEQKLKTYSPLTLAFIGDAVYDLYVRTKVVLHANCAPSKLHASSVKYVRAKAQSLAIDRISEELSPEEYAVYKRGFNASPHTLSKNSDPLDYHKATGLEALVGYLYLSGDTKRLDSIMSKCIEIEEVL